MHLYLQEFPILKPSLPLYCGVDNCQEQGVVPLSDQCLTSTPLYQIQQDLHGITLSHYSENWSSQRHSDDKLQNISQHLHTKIELSDKCITTLLHQINGRGISSGTYNMPKMPDKQSLKLGFYWQHNIKKCCPVNINVVIV